MKHCSLLFIFGLFFHCSCSNAPKQQEDNNSFLNFGSEPDAKTIVIQPYADMSSVVVDSVYKQLLRINPNTRLEKSIPLPQTAFYKPRNRYRADSLIALLWKQCPENSIVIGLTSKDISTTKGDVKDWGVMGLGYCPGKSCVVSSFRMNKNNLHSQLIKTVVHELGHTLGLPHCKRDKTCFMKDAEGKNDNDQLLDFCPYCKSYLIDKGWKLDK